MEIKNCLVRNESCIYCLRFPNGMRYIGKTSHLGNRMRLYLRNVENGDGGKVCDAIREFGVDAIGVDVLSVVSGLGVDDTELCLSILEIKYIREMDTLFPKGYNVSLGGEALRIPPECIITDKEEIRAFKSASKRVLVYDIDGKFLSEYDSLSRMDYELGLSEKDYGEYLDKKKPIADKYYLRSKRYNVIPDKIEVTPWVVKERVKWNTTFEERTIVKERVIYSGGEVIAYDVNGDFVGEYKNRAEASRMLTGAQRMDLGKYYKGYIFFKKTSDDYPRKIESYLEMKGKAIEEEYKPVSELGDLPTPIYVPRVVKQRKKSRVNLDYPISQFKFNGELVATYDSIRDASELTGIPYCQIYNCVKGTTKTCQGFLWRKVEESSSDNNLF